jgi:serine/threonine-protein kinase
VGAGARFCSVCGAAVAPSGEVGEDQLLARLRQATLGEYDVLRELGRGGMAAVYLAWDRELARYVAVKVLLPELAHQATMSQRFLQEARTAANLDDHPSVVRVYRAKESQGLRYFVMKYVDGCSLDLLLRAAEPFPGRPGGARRRPGGARPPVRPRPRRRPPRREARQRAPRPRRATWSSPTSASPRSPRPTS